jgi:hypothetical protein
MSVSSLIRDYFKTREVHVVVDSHAFTEGIHTHTFEDTRDLFDEVFWACIYAGFHYHPSLAEGGQFKPKSQRAAVAETFPAGEEEE